ncbi:hypothetical protein SPSIL_057770 [Sporomusa silvacetica DSM 10669]|uniref:FAD-binding PCMH-type domain-containing protein n=1 Tax=Sporomusa silvacetica DSM 10669 TaxID=1123289 RepID=A0ABZ3IVS9_9FIRM|nr:FAD-binding oxidoreductase [Sporomusa silvacetica]OZC14275.1 putative FAD-linked oxidoreductase [Sporomusa silvacetica DSM 10669]
MRDVKAMKVSTSEQLKEILRKAQTQNTPVSLYRKPRQGGIALDLSEWNEVELFDVENLMIVVPPGILLQDLRTLTATHGLRFIPADTPALQQLSVGEWAYRGCPNPLAWKYGAGKHFLLGSSYVFPNGEMTPVGGKCIKNVTGYDFTRFLTGAYSDLAIGVQYIIKLMPQPAFRHRYDVTFKSLSNVIEFVGKLQARSVPPAYFFWADEKAGSKLFGKQQQGHRVLFEFDGNEVEVRDAMAAIDSILAGYNIKSAAEAATLPDISFLENTTDGFWLVNEFKISYTVAEKFQDRLKKMLDRHGWGGGLFGQLAEGKVHLYIEKPQPEVSSLITALQDEVCALGGATSGKYARLYGSGAVGALAVLENTFKKRKDPQLIFNQAER